MSEPFHMQSAINETVERLEPQAGNALLEVACGTGALLETLSRSTAGLRLTGVEASLAALATARRRLGKSAGIRQGRAEQLPFPDQSFDLVVSVNALHGFPYQLGALMEMKRVLRTNGRLVITDWCGDYPACWLLDKWLRLTDSRHNRTLGHKAFRRLLQQAGFSGIRIEHYRVNRIWGLMTARAAI